MKTLFWACLLCLIPGLLIRIPFGGGGILLSDILVPLFALCYLGKKLLIDQQLPSPRFIVPALGFGLVALLSWLWGAWDLLLKEQILSFSYIVRFVGIVVLGWAVVDQLEITNYELRTQKTRQMLLNIFTLVGVVVLLGYFQFYLYPDISKFSTAGGFDPHIGRLLGTWMDPNFVGGLLAFSLPLMMGFWYQDEWRKPSGEWQIRKFALAGLIVICLYALFLTFSRSAYLAGAGGLALFFLLRDPKIILVGIVLAGLGLATSERAQKRVGELAGTMAAVVLRDTDEVDATAKLRVQSWQRSFELWQKYPVLGIGYNTYRFRAAEEGVVDEKYFSAGGSDSTLLTILVTTGVVGLLFFLWFCADLWLRNFVRWWRHPRSPHLDPLPEGEEDRQAFGGGKIFGGELYLGFVAGFSAILVHSLFVNSLLFPLIFMPIMVVAGILESQVIERE